MRIRWTTAAAEDLQHISDYLKEHHPHYRDATLRKLYDTIRELKQVPGRGRPGHVDGTREILFLPLPYVAVYRVKDESIEVLRVYHAAQDRP
jgi:plasmid stabilization system protein ParE